jgi:hypothetical protein
MTDPKFNSALALLNDVAGFAARCEQVLLHAQQKRPPGAVAYMTLVAQRRFGQAIATLHANGAYESRVLLRSMLEHYFNLAWILLRSSHRRANRFIKFLALERLRVLESLPAEEQKEHAANLRRLRAIRSRHRRLFRQIDPKSKKRFWSRSWAGTMSFEARVREVSIAELKFPGAPKPFVYTMYRWFSASTHGNVLHLHQLVRPTRYGGRPVDQPESYPWSVIAGAAVLLLGTVKQASRVLNFSNSMKEELAALDTRVTAFANSLATA